jgi:polyisoprenoid-binding protein YceI
MKRLLTFFVLLAGFSVQAQKYTAEKSFVSFYSKAAIEDITAQNTKSQSIFNSATGDIVFVIPTQDFEFAKSLMKEHFNEKYMDTEKYPKSTFQGKLSGFDIKATGAQQAKANGKLTIHGVTQEIEIPGTMEVVDGKLVMKSSFIVKLETYNIMRPQLMWQNIAEQVEVKIEFTYKPI